MSTKHVEPAPEIVEITPITSYGSCTMFALMSDGNDVRLFSYYIDELTFDESDLIGKTEDEAHQLHRERDVAFLRS